MLGAFSVLLRIVASADEIYRHSAKLTRPRNPQFFPRLLLENIRCDVVYAVADVLFGDLALSQVQMLISTPASCRRCAFSSVSAP